MKHLRALLAGVIRGVIEQLIPGFEAKTGHRVKATLGSGGRTRREAAVRKGGPKPAQSGAGAIAMVAKGEAGIGLDPSAAKALPQYLASPEAAVYEAHGLQTTGSSPILSWRGHVTLLGFAPSLLLQFHKDPY